jgi:hypothetical protein
VIRAVLAGSGDLDVDDIVLAADTSKRTIFRLFGDLISLRAAAASVGLEQCSIEVGPEPIPSYVSRVIEPYLTLGPLLNHVPRRLAEWQDRLIHSHFGGKLYPLQLHAIATLSGWSAWRTLTRERGCSDTTARRVLEIGVKRLLR